MINNTRSAGRGNLMNIGALRRWHKTLIGIRALCAFGLGKVGGVQQPLLPCPRTPLPTSPTPMGPFDHYNTIIIANAVNEWPLETPVFTPLPAHTAPRAFHELSEPPLETPLSTRTNAQHTASGTSSERSYAPSPISTAPTSVTDFSHGAEDDKELRPSGSSTSAAFLVASNYFPIATSGSPIPQTLVPGHHLPLPARTRANDTLSQPIPSFPSTTPQLPPIAYQPNLDPFDESSSSPGPRQQYLLPSDHQRPNRDTTPITPNFSDDVLVADPQNDDLGLPRSASFKPPPAPISRSVVEPSSSPPKLDPIPDSGPFRPYDDETSAPPPVPKRNPARLRRPYSVDTPVTPDFDRPPPRQTGEPSNVAVPAAARYNTNSQELCYTPDLVGEGFHARPGLQWEHEVLRQDQASFTAASASRQPFPNPETNPCNFSGGLEVIVTTPTSSGEEETSGNPAQQSMNPLELNPGPGSSNYAQGDYDCRGPRASNPQKGKGRVHEGQEIRVQRNQYRGHNLPRSALYRSQSTQGPRQQSHEDDSLPSLRPIRPQTPGPRRPDSTHQHHEQRNEWGQEPNQHRRHGHHPHSDHPKSLRRSVTDPQDLRDRLDDELARNPPRATILNPNLSPFDSDPRSPESSSEHESSLTMQWPAFYSQRPGFAGEEARARVGAAEPATGHRKHSLLKMGKNVMTFFNGEGRKKF